MKNEDESKEKYEKLQEIINQQLENIEKEEQRTNPTDKFMATKSKKLTTHQSFITILKQKISFFFRKKK